jgi:putative spermidine/putrescine transport system substrate-binding protein
MQKDAKERRNIIMGKWSIRLNLIFVVFIGLPLMEVGAAPELPAKIVWVDTAGGANFQEFHKTWTIPAANRILPFKVEYVVSRGAEMIERLKAWKPGKGDLHVILFKPDSFVGALEANIPLEILLPNPAVPNATKIPLADLATVLGTHTEGKGLQFWRDQFGFIYNRKFIKKPPTSFKEFLERKDEWRGHIGMIRTDAKSGGGRIFMYDFLRAFGVDWTKPFGEISKSPEWNGALGKFKEFSEAFYKPLAGEPPIIFEQFMKEDVWITEYAIDYCLWSRDKGRLPETTAASYASEGIYGGNTLLAIPGYIPSEYKPAAIKFVNWLLSDLVQLTMFTTMWEYPGTEIFDIVTPVVWTHVPRMERLNRKALESKQGYGWIKENGMNFVK